MNPYSPTDAPLQPPDRKRDPAIDMIRIFALVSVPSIHFYLNNEYYYYDVVGIRMGLMTIHRTSLLICVPLFMVLTGYLSCYKRPGKGCYAGLVKNIITYVLACAACILYRRWAHIDYPFPQAFFNILNYTAAPYGWYVEMYIGLALLAPFLNVLYHGLPSKEQKHRLLGVMLLLTAVPCLFNTYDFLTEGWLKVPSISSNYQKILPSWWQYLYPVTYYFIGCYLREYPPKVKKRASFSVYIVSSFLFGVYAIYRSDGGKYSWGAYLDGWYSLLVVILTVSVFIFFMNIPTDRFPPWLIRILAMLSDLCLGAYLVSWIFDSILYPKLNAAVPDMQLRMNWFLLIVPASVTLSFALSYLLNLIQRMLLLCFHTLFKRKKP